MPVSAQVSTAAGHTVLIAEGNQIVFGRGPEVDLAISAGGFHPHYPPPGELAGMRRVSVDLSPRCEESSVPSKRSKESSAKKCSLPS